MTHASFEKKKIFFFPSVVTNQPKQNLQTMLIPNTIYNDANLAWEDEMQSVKGHLDKNEKVTPWAFVYKFFMHFFTRWCLC